jgi:hypothetical protein
MFQQPLHLLENYIKGLLSFPTLRVVCLGVNVAHVLQTVWTECRGGIVGGDEPDAIQVIVGITSDSQSSSARRR